MPLFQPPSRFRLPHRIRSDVEPADGFAPRIALADRIAELPGIVTKEDDDDTVPRVVRVYLNSRESATGPSGEPTLFCEVGSAGIVLHGLTSWDKHQVLSKGWGTLRKRDMLIFMPRFDRETEICWSILRRGYDGLIEASTNQGVSRAWAEVLPRFSRTSLQ